MSAYNFLKRTLIINLLIFSVACAVPFESIQINSSSPELFNAQSVEVFSKTVYPIINNNCAACHGVDQKPMFIDSTVELTQKAVINFGLVNIKDSSISKMVIKIKNSHQNIPVAIGSDIESAINNWITQIQPEPIPEPIPEPTPEPIPEPTPEPTSGGIEAKFSSIHKLVLVPKCVGCHSLGGIRSKEDYTDFRSTLATGKVVVGNANRSAMYTECRDQNMPIGSASLTSAELLALKTWIDNGAQDN